MKYVIVVPDGSADNEIASIGGRTPLAAAKKPFINELAKVSTIGTVRTIPVGLSPGSDVGNLSLMGYDPLTQMPGRSPLEVNSMGIDMADGDVAYRANFITVSGDGAYEDMTILNHDAGVITTEESRDLIDALNERFATEKARFYTGTQYRHCLLVHGGSTNSKTVPPHDHLDQRVGDWLPTGDCSEELRRMMRESYDIMNDHPVNRARRAKGLPPANSLWIWGQGKRPDLEDFNKKYGVKGAVISAIDLIKGIAMYAGLDILPVEGITGTIDTNYEGKAQAALEALAGDKTFVYVHVEGPDECSHEGNLENKMRCISYIDQRIIRPVVEGLRAAGEDFRLLVVPDHRTPLAIRTHSSDPVPFVLYDSTNELPRDESKSFDERSAAPFRHYEVAAKLINGFFGKQSKS